MSATTYFIGSETNNSISYSAPFETPEAAVRAYVSGGWHQCAKPHGAAVVRETGFPFGGPVVWDAERCRAEFRRAEASA